jgi:hypothetical protein
MLNRLNSCPDNAFYQFCAKIKRVSFHPISGEKLAILDYLDSHYSVGPNLGQACIKIEGARDELQAVLAPKWEEETEIRQRVERLDRREAEVGRVDEGIAD